MAKHSNILEARSIAPIKKLKQSVRIMNNASELLLLLRDLYPFLHADNFLKKWLRCQA